jgi:hypothetical protein
VKIFLALGAMSAAILYLWYEFKPPPEVVGSTLRGFDTSDRTMRMIRAERDQRQGLGFPLA